MRALVIGGGIGGLAAAIALRLVGWEAAVFERAPAFGEVGAGLTLWANAVRALDSLGVGAALREGSLSGEGGGIHTWRGKTLSALSPEVMAKLTGAPSVAVHRAELVSLLAKSLGSGGVRLNARCVDYLQNGAGVIARFADGSVEHGDILIGADGLHSIVRGRLFGESPPRYAGYAAWRGVVDYDAAGLKIGEYLGRGQRFGLVPLRGGRLYWFATANGPSNQPPPAAGHLPELLRRFGDWCDPIPAVLRRTDPAAVLHNDIYDRDPLPRWGDGRVTLLGDAAHPMTPNLGQGACQAIEDAAVLGQCLTGTADGPGAVAALRVYEARRMPRTAKVVLHSRRLGRVMQAEGGIACWFRDRLIGWTPAGVQMRSIAKLVNRAGPCQVS